MTQVEHFRSSSWIPRLAATSLAVIALLSAACSGNSKEPDFDGGPQIISNAAKINPVIVSTELTTLDDRISIGLLDEQQQPVADAALRYRFFTVVNNQGTLFAEVDAIPVIVKQSYTDKHTDGTIETHEVGQIGVYVAHVDFPSAGEYGVQIVGNVNGKEIDPLQVRFNVLEDTPSIGIGEIAPKTLQPTLRDVADLSEIDTSDPPDPAMHQQTIAEAVSSGTPTVIVFATPSFCQSRICGPVKQTVDEVAKKFAGQVNFIHVEPFDLQKARTGVGLTPLPFLDQEWGLETEPWVYVVGKDGRVTARFEAAVSQEEIESAVRSALSAP